MDFQPIEYFKQIAKENRLCRQHRFKTITASGPDNMEALLQNFRDTENFVIVDDFTDNNVYNSRPSWFTRSVYTVWIIASTSFRDTDDQTDRRAKMALCRQIFRQFLSRMIHDKATYAYGDGMTYLDLSRIYYKELGRYSFNGATGLYFMVENSTPTDLVYHAEEWQ